MSAQALVFLVKCARPDSSFILTRLTFRPSTFPQRRAQLSTASQFDLQADAHYSAPAWRLRDRRRLLCHAITSSQRFQAM